ncbi:hypothetical protein BGZ65_009772, partial [Modicella reniformis]
MSGIFAQSWIAGLEGVTVINGGWLDKNWIRVPYQIADSVAGLAWSFGVTYLILFIMNK